MTPWKKMPAPKNKLILVGYDDGDAKLIHPWENDYDWVAYTGKQISGIVRPKYWMSVRKVPK